MARPTRKSDKLMQRFAARIRAELDSLVEQYDMRLADRPGYIRLPVAMRRDLERQLLNLIADALVQGDSRELVEHVRQRAVEWDTAGLEMAWFLASLTVPEDILVPLIDSVEASTFLWQALNRSQSSVWQIVAERARQAEQTLRQSQQLLQTVMDNIPQAVFWKDQNLTYLGCNRAFAEDAGLASPLEIVGKTDRDMPWKDLADLYRADDSRVMENGTPKLDYEEPQTTPDGSTIWLRTSKVPMLDAAGKVTAVLGMYEDITERKQVEAAVRESQQRFQGLVETLNDWIWEVDPTGTYTYVSPKVKDLLGYAPEEVLGKTPFDFMPADEAQRVAGIFGPLLTSRQALINLENTNLHHDGHLVMFETSGVPFFDADGQFRGYRGTDRDVAERKRAEAALARERNLLRTLIDNLPDQVFFKDATGRIILYNEADARAMGIASTEAAVGKTVYDLYPRELADLYYADDMAVIHSDQPLLNREEPGLDEAGQPRWILTTKVPLKDAQGNRLGLVGVARDITARRKIELSLQQSEERFRRLSEATSEGLVFHDKGVILDANPAVIAMFGFTAAADMIGRSILEVIAPECHPLVMQKMQQQDVHPYEIECIRQDGTRFPVETATRTYQYEDRTVRASSIRDVTRRKQLEQAIRQSFERRGREVEVSRQVAQEIATTTDADDIFPLVVKLIKERFDYYHAQIFRYDATQDAVVLIAGYGEAGQQMLAAGHRLAMGRGVVGTAAKTGESILAADSAADEDWRPNPYLPATKGELAVPIKFQDEMLGILDVQSDKVNALTQEDVLLLEGLAGQIAVAIASTRTLEEANTFRALVDAAGQGIAIADMEGRPVYANAAVTRMFGLETNEALAAQPITDFYPEAERARVQESVGQAIQAGQWTGELRILPANGAAPISTINNTFPIRDRNGNLRYIANIITDITERKLAEQRLGDAVRLARIGYWSYDVPTDTFTFNDQFFTLMHTTVEREGSYTMSSGQYTQRFVYPDDAPLVGVEIGKALETADPNFRGEVSHRVYFGDGELGYVTVRFTIEKDTQGRTIRTNGANQDITEIRLAEESIRRSQAELSQALQIAKLAYWEYDVEKDLFLFNDQFFSIFHTTAEQHGGYRLSSAYYSQHFVFPEDLPIVGAEIEKALNSTDRHYSRSLEHRILYGDGGIGYITVSINIDRDDQGKILRYYGANQDITDRKLAEEAVRRSEAELSQALQIAKLAYWEYDVEKDLFLFNDQFFSIFHTTAEQHGGYQFTSAYYAEHFVYPEDLPIVGAEIEKALNSTDRHYSRSLEHRILYGDGGIGYITVSINIDRDDQGKILRYYGANQDITDRKQAEEAVRRSEAELSQALQIAKLAYWEYDVEKDLFLFNDQFFSIFHTTAEQHGGYQFTSAYYAEHFVYPEDLPIVGAEIEKALNSTDRHYSRSLEHRILYGDGGIGHITVSINIDRDEQGKILRYYGANQDITDRKLAEEIIHRNEAQLSEALKTARLAYWELDVARQKFVSNDQLYALLHTTAEAEGGYEMDVNAYVGRFIYPEDIPYVGTSIAKGLQDPDPNVSTLLEARVVCADGEVRWLATQVSTRVDAAGQPIKAVGTNQDITDRKQAEETIRRSQAQLTEALRIAQLANWSYDVPTDTFTFNDQFYAMMHTTAEREGGYTMSSTHYAQRFVHPDDAALVGVEIGKALTTTDPNYRGEVSHRVYFGDGEPGYVTVRFTVEQDEHGHTIRTLGANQNVTAAKLAELERERLLQDVQRRATQVEAVAEVGAAAAALLEPQALLESIVRLTRRRFDLYHCHVFLMDEAGQTLKVQACGWRDPEDENRPAGDRVIRADAAQSLVARAARTRQPVIVNDVHTEPGWLPNPLLPDVQSEMALPMIVGDRVLGVFNVHADERDHFSEEDAQAMLTLATQTAIALQNARLFAQTQSTAEELDLLNRRLTGEAWETYLQRKTREHVILAKSDSPTAPDPLPMLNESLAAGQVVVEQASDQPAQTITTPIVLRGQTVGALRVQAGNEAWGDDVQLVLTSIASHIAQAAENTRLLEESEIRFARERALAEATDNVRRRTEVEHILETAAAELAQYLQASAVSVRVGNRDNSQGGAA